MSKYLGDILVLIGCGFLVCGAYELHPIAAIFTGGALLIILGVLVELSIPGGKRKP